MTQLNGIFNAFIIRLEVLLQHFGYYFLHFILNSIHRKFLVEESYLSRLNNNNIVSLYHNPNIIAFSYNKYNNKKKIIFVLIQLYINLKKR